ncbi:hypothetical protein D3C74_50050 [compost metagenome]
MSWYISRSSKARPMYINDGKGDLYTHGYDEVCKVEWILNELPSSILEAGVITSNWKNFEDAFQSIEELITQPGEKQTVVIDSMSTMSDNAAGGDQMSHKIMPVTLHKNNWGKTAASRQLGKSGATSTGKKSKAENKAQMGAFLRGKY